MIHPSILKASKHPDPAFIFRKACPRCWAVAAEEPSVFSGGFGGSILIGWNDPFYLTNLVGGLEHESYFSIYRE